MSSDETSSLEFLNIKKTGKKWYKLSIFNIFVYGLICVLLFVAWLGLRQNHVKVHCNSHAFKMIIEGLRFIVDFIFRSGEKGSIDNH